AAGGRTSSLATGPSGCDRVPVGEAGGVVAAHRAVLEEAPALLAVERRPGHVVDDAEGDPGGDGRVAQVVGGALDPAPAPPPAVAPVGVAAVAGADVEGDVAEGGDLEVERAPAPLPEPQPGPLGQAGAGPVADLDLGPAELLDPPVGPHPHGVVEGAVPVGLLLDDDDQREALEAQRYVEPPEPGRGVVRRPARRLGLADGADAPGAVAGADPAVGRDREVLALHADRPGPRADLGEPGRVDDRPGPGEHDVAGLHDRRERRLPPEVHPEAPVGGVADHPQATERLDDLDAEGPDGGGEAVVAERVGAPHDPLAVAP